MTRSLVRLKVIAGTPCVAIELRPILATRITDARPSVGHLRIKLTTWSLKVAVYEHQFKVIGEAQKTFMVREMIPKDIDARVLDGAKETRRNHGKVGDHHQRNMMADDGPVPMDLEKLSVRTMRERRRVTRTRATTCRMTMCV